MLKEKIRTEDFALRSNRTQQAFPIGNACCVRVNLIATLAAANPGGSRYKVGKNVFDK